MVREAQTQHTWLEDLQALLIGATVASLGVVLYTKATLLTGGVARLALLVEFVGWSDFGAAFFVLNLPFYALAVLRMGWSFGLRTLIAVTLISALARYTPLWIALDHVHPAYAAIGGGALIGMGMISLMRHKFGVGGTNMLAQFLQERGVIRAGYFQLIIDLVILVLAFFVLPLDRVAWSIVGAVVLNLVLAINHRPGRYRGFS